MMGNTGIKDRLNTLIGCLKISKNKFAIEVGTSSAMISKITTKDTSFGVDLLVKITTRYPKLSKDWLINGNGSMWIESEQQPVIKPSPALSFERACDLLGKNPNYLPELKNGTEAEIRKLATFYKLTIIAKAGNLLLMNDLIDDL